MGLEDYKDIVGTCAAVTTMAQMLAGTLICKDIYKKGTSKGFDPMPFIGGIGMGILMLKYAYILEDSAMINVNLFALTTNVIYMFIFYIFTSDTKSLVALMGKVILFVGIILGYTYIEDPEKIEYRLGIIVTAIMLLLIASPFVHIKEIIKTKNTDILPFPLIFMATLVTSQWLLYGYIISNNFIIFQNVVAFTLSIAQLSLFVIFPSSKKPADIKEKKKE